jgi:hypothetical protein
MRYGPPEYVDGSALWRMAELPHRAKAKLVWNSGPPASARAAVAGPQPLVAGRHGHVPAAMPGRVIYVPIEQRRLARAG